jgi:small subunit ribosomal protein S21
MAMNQKSRISVYIKEGENISQSLRRFKKKVEESGKLETLRKKEFYEKPTTARKRAKGAAKARLRKKLEKEALPTRRR